MDDTKPESLALRAEAITRANSGNHTDWQGVRNSFQATADQVLIEALFCSSFFRTELNILCAKAKPQTD